MFVRSTVSCSTRPIVPTPAAARYSVIGEPRPPAPTHRTRARLRRSCPSSVTSGMIRCRLERRNSSRVNPDLAPHGTAILVGPSRRVLVMSGVRVLVGTKKGGFILTSDGKRKDWKVEGPHFAGWELYHIKGSPKDPNRIYASQTSGWFGQVVQRSDDGGKTWDAVGNQFPYEGTPGTHQWYDGTPHPWEFKRVWHLEPSLDDPDTVYAGIEDAAIFKS